MISSEALRERIDSAPNGLRVFVELSFPEGIPLEEVSTIGNRAIRHLFEWKPDGIAETYGYQRDGFEYSHGQSGVIRGVRNQRPYDELSIKEREDRDLAAAHIIQVWPDLKLELAS